MNSASKFLKTIALAAVLAVLAGCATIQSVADWWTLNSQSDAVVKAATLACSGHRGVKSAEPKIQYITVVCNDGTGINVEYLPAPETPPAKVAYVVEPGQRVMKPATSLSFTALMARDGSAENEDVILFACADDQCDTWAGGNSSTFSVRVNSYSSSRWKMKVYGLKGYCGEPTVDQPWKAGVAAKVKFEVEPGLVRLTVNDAKPIEQPCATPKNPTLGIGWPPSVRQGALGAQITDEVWGNGGMK